MFMLQMNVVKSLHIIFRIFFIVIISGSFTGCSTLTGVKDSTVKATKATVNATTKVLPYMGGPDSGIIRTVALVPFKNETIFGQLALEKVFEGMIVKYISESCSGVRLLDPDSPGFPEFLKAATSSAGFDNLTMADKGREAGLNAIITGGVLNLSVAQEDEGILWFRETKEKFQTQFILEVFDMETGAKIFDDRFVQEIKDMAPEEIQAFKTGQPALFASVTENLGRLSQDIAPKICNAIMAQPWTGYVGSVEGNRVNLSFGKNIGIKSGDVLEVHDHGKVVENVSGQRFIIPGEKIGEIRISQMEDKFSTGEIISGENIHAGNLVKIKR
jgi:hypothetical protein